MKCWALLTALKWISFSVSDSLATLIVLMKSCKKSEHQGPWVIFYYLGNCLMINVFEAIHDPITLEDSNKCPPTAIWSACREYSWGRIWTQPMNYPHSTSPVPWATMIACFQLINGEIERRQRRITTSHKVQEFRLKENIYRKDWDSNNASSY